ncbi:hypothetical protein [Selenomonas ruminantium]|uniref:hypothetical protein n=1 Tax=Selenomonas ruminantium TaxID=971 RepID=UPI0015B9279C|nr:hypothetical protein [Selenomonas ruminantium]
MTVKVAGNMYAVFFLSEPIDWTFASIDGRNSGLEEEHIEEKMLYGKGVIL